MMIVDIDFRHVERDDIEHDGSSPFGRQVTVNVLQWRKKVPKADSVRFAFGFGKVALEYEWTEWQDVRTEVE
jgi:hypothetical protein